MQGAPENWRDVKRALEAALDQPVANRRPGLQQTCPDDRVRAEVLRLLDEVEASTGFLDSPPALVANAVLGKIPEPPLLAPEMSLAGRFRIERLIGRGGMGEVYEAYDLQSHTSVALKIIQGRILEDPKMVGLLRSELVLARSVTHRNVCRIFELHQASVPGLHVELFFLTMELLQGETLKRRLDRAGRLDSREVLKIARQLTAALASAHDAGVVHGDLKPANIMLEPHPGGGQPRVVVMDFGIAQSGGAHTLENSSRETPSLGGSLGYMAPEQSSGGSLSSATDIYALGVVMHEMLTGCRPDPLVAANLPPPWRSVIRRCLEQQPQRRFQTAPDVLHALEHRFPTLKAAAALGVCAIAAGAGFYLHRLLPPNSHAPAIAVRPRKYSEILRKGGPARFK